MDNVMLVGFVFLTSSFLPLLTCLDYETLSYSKSVLLNHQEKRNSNAFRVRRSPGAEADAVSQQPINVEQPIYLSFNALNRQFHLRLHESRRHVFAPEFYVQSASGGCQTLAQVLDESRKQKGIRVSFVRGQLADKGPVKSEVYGYASDGVFFGRIKDLEEHKSFYVDSLESFTRNILNRSSTSDTQTADSKNYINEKRNENDGTNSVDVPHSVIYDESSLVLDPLGLNIEQVDVTGQDDSSGSGRGNNTRGRLDRYSDKEEERSTCAYNGATQIYMQQIQSEQPTHTYVSDDSLSKHKLSLDSDSAKEWLQNRIRRSSSGSGERNSNSSDGDDGSSTAPNSIHKKNTCLLSITSDHLFTAQYRDASVVTGEIANFVSELNSIFEQLVFSDGTKGYGFAIAKITIEDESSLQRDDYKYKDPYIGVEKLLDLVSTEDHSEYCLAYLFTARDFMKGVLGLAWVAGDSASGGICESYKMHQNGQMKSLNTGVITTVNYGQPVAARVSHLTFTHEVGHNWGSPHDFPQDCKPGGQQGNFIMFASATSADKPNNNRFSHCSVSNMSHILFKRRDECFKEAGRAICGNMVLDEGEECDCGFEPNCLASGDQCCHPAGTNPSAPSDSAASAGGTSLGCTLKPGLRCSPSQGPCCTAECQLVEMSERQLCQEATECVEASYCDGTSVLCSPVKKPNLTDCNGASQVCLDGVCAGSVCLKYDMEDCLCSGEDYLCDICCQKPNQPTTCESSALLPQFGYNRRMKYIGSPCDDMNGYCDAFNRCMAIDSNGPLSRLRDAIFNPDVYRDIFAWAKAHWWLTVIICVASSILFILFVKVFSVHTPSSNPNLPKNRQIRDTVSTLPRTIRRSTATGGGRSNSGGRSSRSRAHLQYQSGQPYNHPPPHPIAGDSGPPDFIQPPLASSSAPPPQSGPAPSRGSARAHSHDSRKDKRRRNGRNNRDCRREGGGHNGNEQFHSAGGQHCMDPRLQQQHSYDSSYPPPNHHRQQQAATFNLHSTAPGHQFPPGGGGGGTGGHEAMPLRDIVSPPPYSE